MLAGGIISLCTIQLPARHGAPAHALTIGALHLGRAALFHYPLAATGRLCSGDGTSSEDIHQWAHTAFKEDPYALCGYGSEDPFHVLTECSHLSVADARADATARIPGQVERLCASALEACLTADESDDSSVIDEGPYKQALGAVKAATNGADWVSVLSWAEAAAPSNAPLAAAIGRVFDMRIAKTHRLRHLANCWVRSAATDMLRLVDTHLQCCPLPLPSQAPL